MSYQLLNFGTYGKYGEYTFRNEDVSNLNLLCKNKVFVNEYCRSCNNAKITKFSLTNT